jgi:hypothetical protein
MGLKIFTLKRVLEIYQVLRTNKRRKIPLGYCKAQYRYAPGRYKKRFDCLLNSQSLCCKILSWMLPVDSFYSFRIQLQYIVMYFRYLGSRIALPLIHLQIGSPPSMTWKGERGFKLNDYVMQEGSSNWLLILDLSMLVGTVWEISIEEALQAVNQATIGLQHGSLAYSMFY